LIAKRFAIFSLVLLSLFTQTVPAFADAFPEPEGFVSDFAKILSSETKQELEQQLTQLEKDSTIEIAVVTVDSLGGTTIEDYAVRLFEEWRIGKEDEDNGVLLLIYPSDRKLRLDVGYGLEPLLTDSKAGRVIRNIITPEFKNENYDKGVTEGVAAIIKVVHGEEVDLGEEAPSESEEEEGGLWVLFFIGVIFLSYLSSFLSRSKRWWPGGVIGAILGVILGGFMASFIISVLAAISLGILGLIFDFILSKNYKKRKAGGLPTSWWSSGGGFFGALSSTKGGSGGGFGGFGGGRSGGGGASGGW